MNNIIVSIQTLNLLIKINQEKINQIMLKMDSSFVFSEEYGRDISSVITCENHIRTYTKAKDSLIERMLNA